MANQRQSAQHKIPAFVDFEIEIEAKAGKYEEYTVSVSSPSGEARETMKFPFSADKLESQLKDIQIALLRSATPGRLALSEEARAVQEFGRLMFNSLMTGEVRNTYAASQILAREQDKGLRLKLRINPPELAALPWEFLFDSRQAEYVCLSRNTPVVRYIDVPLPVNPVYSQLPLRVLGMVASPADQPPLKVAAEKRRVNEALAPLIQSGQLELKWLDGGTWQDLYNAMDEGPWHVFHFIGHGGYDRTTDEGTILLEDPSGSTDYMRATQLARLLADHPSMRLVILNSCEGARGGREDLFSSTASILVRRGIPAVLAMQYQISDAGAIAFSTHFYKALAEGWPVDAAVSAVRISMSLLMDDSLEWGTPVLYMRSRDGVLFNIDPRSRQQVTSMQPAERPAAKSEPVKIPERSTPIAPAIEKTSPPDTRTTPVVEPARGHPVRVPKSVLWGGGAALVLVLWICLLVVGPKILNFINPPVVPVATDTPTVPPAVTPPTEVPLEPTPIPSDLPRGTTINYVVQQGDTLAAIATKFNSTVSDIVRENQLADANPISPGQLLVIPVNIVTPAATLPSMKTPVEAITDYWKNFGDANYEAAWNLLSAGYRQRNYQGVLNNYMANQVKKYCSVTLGEPRVLTTTPKTVFVLGRVVYQLQPSCKDAPNLLVHEMTLENATWKIDRVLLGVRSDSNCASAPRRLSAGIRARIATQSDALLTRAFPAPPEGQYIYDRLPPNTEVDVLEGPICGEYKENNFWWWKVRSPNGVEGWLVEGSDAADPIWIEPVP